MSMGTGHSGGGRVSDPCGYSQPQHQIISTKSSTESKAQREDEAER